MEYIDEKILTKKPLLIDLLVIKKEVDEKIDNPIGSIFRRWNVMEYKSPTDYVSLDDFYKVGAYAYLLKADADTADEIKFEDITISFVSNTIAENLFEHLETQRKYVKTTYVKGIYYFQKEGDIPVQFIIPKELGEKHKWLAGLTNKISKEMLHSLVKDYKEKEKNEYKEAVLDAILKANHELLRQIKEEEDMTMSKEVLEIFRPEIEEAEIKGEIKGKADLILIIKKKRLKGLEPETIADMLELETDYVKAVVDLIDKAPNASAIEISRKLMIEFDKQLA